MLPVVELGSGGWEHGRDRAQPPFKAPGADADLPVVPAVVQPAPTGPVVRRRPSDRPSRPAGAGRPAQRPRVHSLIGPPGAGTTSVARRRADEAGREGRPVVWLRAAGPVALQVDLLLAAEQCGADSVAGLFDHLGDGERPALVVADGVVDPDLVRPHLPLRGNVELLITGPSARLRRLGPVSRVPPLDVRAARRLVAAALGRAAARRVGDRLHSCLDGRPLGLRLAVATLADPAPPGAAGGGHTVDEVAYLARLAGSPSPLEAAIDVAVDRLGRADAAAPRLLAALAALGPTEVPRTALAERPPELARLDALVASGLVVADGGWLRVPAAVRRAVRPAPRPTAAVVVEAAAGLLAAVLGPSGCAGPDRRPWIVALADVCDLLAGVDRFCPRAASLVEAALADLTGRLPDRLLLPLREARARLVQLELAPDDVAAWRARRELAAARVNAGRARDAVGEFERLFTEVGPALGPRHPDTLLVRCGRGVALLESGRARAAAAELDEVVPLLATACGGDDPATRQAIRYRAAARLTLGRADEAVVELEGLRAGVPVGDTAQREALTRELAAALLAAGRPADALGELDTVPDPIPTDELALLVGRRLRGSALLRLGRAEPAAALLESTARRLDVVTGPESAAALAAWCELMAAHDASGQRWAAAALAEGLVPACRAALGAGHPLTLSAVARLASARLDRQDPGAAVELLTGVLAALPVGGADGQEPEGDPWGAVGALRALLTVAATRATAPPPVPRPVT